MIESSDLEWLVVESPVVEAIKLGLPDRDKYITSALNPLRIYQNVESM